MNEDVLDVQHRGYKKQQITVLIIQRGYKKHAVIFEDVDMWF